MTSCKTTCAMPKRPHKAAKFLLKITDSDAFFLSLFIFLLGFFLLRYYENGTFILGGEGNYVIDFATHLKNFGFIWFPTYGVGVTNVIPSGTGVNIFLLWAVEVLTKNPALVNFCLVFSIYFLPFFGMYLACRGLKTSPALSFLAAFFYLINPFTFYYLTCLNQWNVFSLAVMPFFFWIVSRFRNDHLRLFFAFGILSMIFSFAYTNPPMLVIIYISLLFSIAVTERCLATSFRFPTVFKKYILLLASFGLCNSWWIFPFFAGGMSSAVKICSYASAEDWLRATVSGHKAALAKMFSFTTIIPDDPHYDFFSFWYTTPFSRIATLIPVLLVVSLILFSSDKEKKKPFFLTLLAFLLAVLFFFKGTTGIFSFIYALLFKYFPLFYVFKTPVEKFGLLYVYAFSITLLVLLRSLNPDSKKTKLVIAVFIFYLLFCSVPLFSGNMIPQLKIGPHGWASRKYEDKTSYRRARKAIDGDPAQFRVLSLPGVGNYQVCLRMEESKKYTGLDPVLMNTSKPFLATQILMDFLYESAATPRYLRLLGIFNVKKMLLNKELEPWFGLIGPAAEEIETILATRGVPVTRFDALLLYENDENARPLVYTSP